MLRVLHQEHAFSDIFVSYLLARNARVQEDLIDQLFQFQRKTACPDTSATCQFRQGGQAPDSSSPDKSGSFRGNGGHHPLTD